MGILDAVREALGLRAEADATRDADPDDLFGMSTAYVTMEADLDYEPAGVAALCFSGVDSTAFAAAVDEVEAVLEAGREETGTTARRRADEHGYRWVVLSDPDFEDLVTSVHFAADTLVERGFGSRLLAALFAFRPTWRATEGPRHVYWVYSFRRGAYYPFAPVEGRERDSTIEVKLRSVLEGELDVEPDTSFWYPLWPDDGTHPWE